MTNQCNYVPWNYWNKKLIFFQKKIHVATKNGNSKEIKKLQQFLLQSTCLLWLASNLSIQYNMNEINQTHDLTDLTLEQIYDIMNQITQYEQKKQQVVDPIDQTQPFKLCWALPSYFRVYYMIDFVVNPVYKLGTTFCYFFRRFVPQILHVLRRKTHVQTFGVSFGGFPCKAKYNRVKQSSFSLNKQCWKQQRQIIKKLAQNLKQPHKQIMQIRFDFKNLNSTVYPTQKQLQAYAKSIPTKKSKDYFEPFDFVLKSRHKIQSENKTNKISNKLDATRLSHFMVLSLKAKSYFYDLMRVNCHCKNLIVYNLLSQIIINQIKLINIRTFARPARRNFVPTLLEGRNPSDKTPLVDGTQAQHPAFRPAQKKTPPSYTQNFALPYRGVLRRARLRSPPKVTLYSKFCTSFQRTKHMCKAHVLQDPRGEQSAKPKLFSISSHRQGGKKVKQMLLGYDLPNTIFLLVPSEKVFDLKKQVCYCLLKFGWVTQTHTICIINPLLGLELLGWHFYINQQTKKVICLPSKTNVYQLKQQIKNTMTNKRYSLNQRFKKTHQLIWKWQNYHKFCYSKKKQLYTSTSRLWIINYIKKHSKMNADMRSKTLKKIFSLTRHT